MGVAPASGSHLPAGREIALSRGGRRHVKGGAPRRAAALSLPLSSRARRSAVCVALWLCVRACQYGHRTDLPGPGELRNTTKPTPNCRCPFAA